MSQNKDNTNGTAAVISIFFPGAGHLYKGQFFKAICLFLMTAAGYIFFIIPGIFMHLIVIWDALKN